MVKPALILTPETNLCEDQPYDDHSYGRICPLLSTGKERADIYFVGQADIMKNPCSPDPRGAEQSLARPARDIFIPDLRLGSGIVPGQPTEGIKVKSRDFR